MCTKPFPTRKRLLRHVKIAHTRISGPEPDVPRCGKRLHADEAHDDERTVINVESTPAELTIIANVLDDPTTATELATAEVDDLPASEYAESDIASFMTAVDESLDEPVLTNEPIDVSTHATATVGAVQNAAAVTIGSSRTSHEGDEDGCVPYTRSGVQGLDGVAMGFPFAADATASCKLVGGALVLRLPMTERLECPRVGCGRGFCAAPWASTRV